MDDLAPEPMGPLPATGVAQPLRRVFGHSVQYALGGLAYKAVALISVPALARLLTPEELGVLDLAVVLALVVSIIGSLGLDTALARFDAEPGDARTLWGSAITAAALGLAFIAGLTLLLAPLLARYVFSNPARADVVAVAALYGCTLAAVTIGLNALRLRDRPLPYAAYGFAIVVGEMIAALSLAVIGAPIAWLVLGWTAASAVGAVALFSREVPSLGRPSGDVIRRLLSFGAPLVPAAVVWMLGDIGLRAVLGDRVGLDALGQYGIASRITSVLALVISGFALAWHPFLYRADRANVSILAERAAVRLTIGLGAAALALTALAPELIGVIAGPGYEPGAPLVGPLSLGIIGFGLVTLASAVLGVEHATRWIAVASIAGAILQVVTGWLLVGPAGMAGIGIGLAAGYALAFCVLVARARLPMARVLLVALAVIAAVGAVTLVTPQGLGYRLAMAAVGVVVFAMMWRLTTSSRTES